MRLHTTVYYIIAYNSSVYTSLHLPLAFCMTADKYRSARSSNADVCVIQNRAYFPKLTVDPNDTASIQHVVSILLQHFGNNDKESLETVAEYTVVPVEGGITNLLFRVTIPPPTTTSTNTNTSYLVRIFGAPGMIDRDEETAIYAQLAQQAIAPPYFGRFANGRIEGWMENMRALAVRELSDPVIAQNIATQMARVHTEFQPTGSDASGTTTLKPQQPSLFVQLQDWCQQAQVATFRIQNDIDRAESLQLAQYIQELSWLQSIIPQDSTTAFCHNDLLAANILYDDTSKRIQLIDFEYGGDNYVAFDIANHFNEYAGGTAPGTLPCYDWLPNKEAQIEFLTHYLRQANQNAKQANGDSMEDSVALLFDHVQVFLLANHTYWGLWAVNQAATEGCDEFDYLLYASKRLEMYHICKEDWKKQYAKLEE